MAQKEENTPLKTEKLHLTEGEETYMTYNKVTITDKY